MKLLILFLLFYKIFAFFKCPQEQSKLIFCEDFTTTIPINNVEINTQHYHFDNNTHGRFSSDKWYHLKRQWGGEDANGGVIPETIYISPSSEINNNGKNTLKIYAQGDHYDGNFLGINRNFTTRSTGTRVGGAIVSKAYFFGGNFTARIKFPVNNGVLTSFWTQFYAEYPFKEDNNEYYKELINLQFPSCLSNFLKENCPPYVVSNNEINFAFPSPTASMFSTFITESHHIIHDWQKLNPISLNLSDGEFHIINFYWIPNKRVDFYIDGILQHSITDDSYIPYISSRLYLGILFPGWLKPSPFSLDVLEVDYIFVEAMNISNIYDITPAPLPTFDSNILIFPQKPTILIKHNDKTCSCLREESYPDYGMIPSNEYFFGKIFSKTDYPFQCNNTNYDLCEDFSSPTFNESKWFIAYRQWGGDENNGGVIPDTLWLENSSEFNNSDYNLKIYTQGDEYDGDILGINSDYSQKNHGKRVGGAIVSKEYYGPGIFEVRMKVPPNTGVVSAIWTYWYDRFVNNSTFYCHNIENCCENNGDNCPEYYLVNHEIDIETGVSLSSANFVSWQGLNPGEYNHYNNKPFNNATLDDDNFHIFTIEWHVKPPLLYFYIDNIFQAFFSSPKTIPFIKSRLWIGSWFPKWGGKADFKISVLEIDWIRYKSFKDEADYSIDIIESDNNVGYAKYPAFIPSHLPNYIPYFTSTGSFEYSSTGIPEETIDNENNDIFLYISIPIASFLFIIFLVSIYFFYFLNKNNNIKTPETPSEHSETLEEEIKFTSLSDINIDENPSITFNNENVEEKIDEIEITIENEQSNITILSNENKQIPLKQKKKKKHSSHSKYYAPYSSLDLSNLSTKKVSSKRRHRKKKEHKNTRDID